MSFRGTFELVAVSEATGCVVDKDLFEVSLVLVSVTTACVDVRGLLEAVVSVGCEITACFVDKGLVVVCEVNSCVGVEVPSDDVWLSAIFFKINLFMNKKVKLQCVTVVNNS